MKIHPPRATTLGRVAYAFWWLFVAGVSATSVLAPNLSRLVQGADAIVTAQVLNQRSEWREVSGKRSIVTLVTVGVEKVHKGSAGQKLTLQFLGGRIGDVSLNVAESPRFTEGERTILFIEGNGENASALVGFFHGKLCVRKNAWGEESVYQHDGTPLPESYGFPKSEKPNRGIGYELFVSRLRELIPTK